MKKFLTVFFLVILAGFLFAETSEDLLKAFKEKKVDEVQSILLESDDENSSLYEDLILEESKKAVKKDDLDYAYQLAEIVLMYDFDNQKAQDLFTSIEKAKKSKAEVAAKEAEKERKRLEEEKKLKEIEEYKALQQQKEDERKAHEKAVSTITKKNFPIELGLSPLSLDFSKSELRDDYEGKSTIDFKYGAGVYSNVGFTHPYLLANLHVNYNFEFLSFGGKGMKSDLESRLTLGSPIVSDFVRLSFGYDCINYLQSDNSVVLTDVYGAKLGFGLENLRFGQNFAITAFFDLNTVAFTSDKINMAFDVDFSCRYDLPWNVFSKKLYVENNTVFNAFQISQKWEYSIDTRLVLGVYLND